MRLPSTRFFVQVNNFRFARHSGAILLSWRTGCEWVVPMGSSDGIACTAPASVMISTS
jgi:hypothetical protein